nr:MAG TPA: hypothetical protein [Caudoviricetes sp.]
MVKVGYISDKSFIMLKVFFNSPLASYNDNPNLLNKPSSFAWTSRDFSPSSSIPCSLKVNVFSFIIYEGR